MLKTTGVLPFAWLIAVPLAAQSTGTPVYIAPYRAYTVSEIGLSLSAPGSGTAFEASFRGGISSDVDVGIRGGLVSGPGPDGRTDALVGGDLRARIVQHSETFPLDGSLTLGLGFESGHNATVGFLPIGFSLGRRVPIQNSSVSIVPYIQPVLMPLFGDASGTDFSIGFGVDARLTPRFEIRVSGAAGDRNGVGITAAFLH